MSIIKKENYSYAFDSNACNSCEGRCCTGESGYIWVNPLEVQKIANFLNISLKMNMCPTKRSKLFFFAISRRVVISLRSFIKLIYATNSSAFCKSTETN